MKALLFSAPLLGSLCLLSLNSCAPDESPAPAETAPASTAELTLKERLDAYLQTDELITLAKAQEERAIDLYMIYSRKFQKHDEMIQESIRGANRSAISNMIRKIEASYPELQKEIEKAFDAEQANALQELQTYRQGAEQAASKFPYKNEQERAELTTLLEQWHRDNDALFQAEKGPEFKERIITELNTAMQARLEICHYYVGCYMGG